MSDASLLTRRVWRGARILVGSENSDHRSAVNDAQVPTAPAGSGPGAIPAGTMPTAPGSGQAPCAQRRCTENAGMSARAADAARPPPHAKAPLPVHVHGPNLQ